MRILKSIYVKIQLLLKSDDIESDKMIKISIILPVYNEELYLKQCLDSLCNQTLKEIEIICVDDGSTDHSLEILRVYESRDNRVKVLTQRNQYAGVARNYGMKHARGKYLLFLDSDDFFQLDMLEKMYQKAEQDQLDITICRYDLFHDMKQETLLTDFSEPDSFFPDNQTIFSGKDMKCAGIFQATIGWAWDKLFLTKFVKKCGYQFPDFRSSEDGFFVYLLMAKADRIGVLKDHFVSHRMYNFNSLSNTKEQNWENGFKMLVLIREELERQKLYWRYEQSFISFAIEFQIYYLTSMFEKKAFYNCYNYIKVHMEPAYHLADYSGKYLCNFNYVEKYRKVLESDVEDFLFTMLREKEEIILKNGEKGWVFPYHLIPKGCKLILYGAGVIGKEYYEQLLKVEYCSDVRLVDQKYNEYKSVYRNVESPKIIEDGEFDYILIAIRNKQTQKNVKEWLLSTGVKKEKIICMGRG
ncbi:MAG: glycosyltransferase family 2 protein [Lachnospiraceae bacterium]|jgi:glycosyltransferase involved in cell wall biosynthesis|nr:glycosyltransferase family 2 protein [Lachnospiraceae bacterium]